MNRLLTRKEAADWLQIGVTTLWRLTKSGSLGSLRIGSRRLYRIEELEAFLRDRIERGPDGTWPTSI